jgi:hypothetical protein
LRFATDRLKCAADMVETIARAIAARSRPMLWRARSDRDITAQIVGGIEYVATSRCRVARVEIEGVAVTDVGDVGPPLQWKRRAVDRLKRSLKSPPRRGLHVERRPLLHCKVWHKVWHKVWRLAL